MTLSKLFVLASLPGLLLAQPPLTLSTSVNPSVFGAPVILTATLSPAAGTGRITFYDGVTVLGSAPSPSGSAAISTILLPSGQRKLRAFFRSAAGNATATSNIVTQQVNANPGGGLVSQPALSVAPAAPRGVAVGDFNGDGKPDLAIAGGNVVVVALGKGDGTFQTPVSYTVGGKPVYVSVGDLDGDGFPDLAVSGTDQLNILLGNGNGTFRQGASYPVPSFPNGLPISIADFNGDGIPDLVRDTVWIGNGDGTFHSQALVADPTGLEKSVVGDWNEDGKPDLLMTTLNCVFIKTEQSGFFSCTRSAALYSGNGDGTFQPATPVISVSANFGGLLLIASGDFNWDGHDDLVIWGAASSPAALRFLPGNGDGTFRPGQIITLSANAAITALTAADFTGDGTLDLAAVMMNSSIYTVNLLIGNGDGTFGQGVSQASPSLPDTPLVADLNGDGRSDLIIPDASGQSLSIILGAAAGSGPQLTVAGGANQSANAGSAFAIPLSVMVRNSGVPVSGVTVTFLAPTGPQTSATLSSSTAVSDASGIASVTAIASQYTGSYIVTATAQGAVVESPLTNTGTPLGYPMASGPQATRPGMAFALPLEVTVLGGGPVGRGVVVRFSAPASGPSAVLSSVTAVTDDSGVARVTAVANNLVGNYIVTATVGDGSLNATFLLVNSADGKIPDLAVGKPASQSSTYAGFAGAAAGSAVDGNTDGNFFHGSVTATNMEVRPWWQVDLGASATVDGVLVWNRTDCCANQLYSFLVFVSDTPFSDSDTPDTLSSRAGTFVLSPSTISNPFLVVPAGAVRGRYLRIQLQSVQGVLSLAEVQVVGAFVSSQSGNLAQGKLARQSSTYPGIVSASASSAVDGNTNGSFFGGSVTATDLDNNPWWQVDLGGAATVDSIVVWNRTDCCGSRLGDYWVFVSNTPFNDSDTVAALQNRAATFASHQLVAPGPYDTILVAFPGRYVRVQLASPGYLSLSEVQVFGSGAPAVTNLAQGKTASQSSTLAGVATDAAGAAVDGNTDGGFYNGSVTATNADVNAWWQVDLGASSAVSSIVVWNRTDCCGPRLGDYWVFVSDTPFGANDTPLTLAGRAGTFASHQKVAPAPYTSIPMAAPGRYVRVQLSGTDYLSLAEVQVFGQ